MQKTRVALIQTAWPGDRDTMQADYRHWVKQAAEAGAQVVCLPEFSLSPYMAGTTDIVNFQWAEPLHGGASDQFFGELARTHHLHVVGSLFEQLADAPPPSTETDRATLIAHHRDTATIHAPDGRLMAFTRKVHIPSGEGYNESHFFEGEADFPVHDVGNVRMAVPTCYDQWFPEMSRICALNGAEFIFYPTAIGSEPTAPQVDTQEAWQTVMRGQAIANGLFIAAANRIGTEGEVTFYGSSFICDPTGKVLAQASRDQAEMIIADLEPTTLEQWRELFPLLHQRRPGIYHRITEEMPQPPPKRWRSHHAFTSSDDRP